MIGFKRKIGSVPAFVLEHSRLGSRGSEKKIAQPMRIENCSGKVLETGEEIHRRSLHENFPTDARRKLFKEGFGSWRRSPSKIAARKFPNRCASKIAQGRFWKLAKKSIEDRCKKISQPMLVEAILFKNGFGNWRRNPSKITA